jgi:hypothetical protein
MTEASGGGAGDGRAEVEGRLIQRSLEDEDFRRRLLEDPKAVVEEELGTRRPEGVQVRAVEESADTVYLVLPSAFACRRRRADLTAVLIRVDPAANSQRGRSSWPHLRA